MQISKRRVQRTAVRTRSTESRDACLNTTHILCANHESNFGTLDTLYKYVYYHLRLVLLRIKNMLDMAVAAMVWWSCGWAIAYGGKTESGGLSRFFGLGSFFTRGEEFADEAGNYGTEEGYIWATWFFQVCGSARVFRLRVG